MARGLFQVNNLGESRWLLKALNFSTKAAVQNTEARMQLPRCNFAQASVMEKYVYVTGGFLSSPEGSAAGTSEENKVEQQQ